ncbi:kinase-like protein [Trametes versicolor FP-101664 SS1]|uniref:kinase-like protein n=1 Tax=Trametes versicolor (strain FP-101664) TaxID=717944 RepID=UPI0004621AA1|nr:kinase-like protein [Trametes versicolor FP-101664 SS1]EIW53406.1 kinase-like protein [Trametes versicolor FP-101664 SS1]
MSVVPIPRRHALAVRNPPAAAPVPRPHPVVFSGDGQAVAVRARRAAPRVLVPASPEIDSDPPSSDNRPKIYTVKGSDVIMKRYRVRGGIGFGSSGTVVRAEDEVTGTAVAIKVFHRDDEMQADVKNEERMYEKVLAGCNAHVDLFAQVLGSGMHLGFHCVVFELCQATLFDVLQGYSGLAPLPMRHIIEIAYQIIKAIGHLHSLGIVHTDIKLENIALKVQDAAKIRWLDPTAGFQDKSILVSSQIRILDLGGAIELQGRGVHHGWVGTRGYRAPEIAFGLPWNRAADNFSIGCVIAELYLSRRLFDNDMQTDREFLAAVERLLGPYSREFAEKIEAKHSGVFSFHNGTVSLLYPPAGSVLSTSDYAESMRRLERIRPLAAQIHDTPLYDLLCKLMAPVPAERISLEAAAKHDFFDSLSRLQWL